MNIAMEQTEEYVNGQLKNKYGDAFIRGNNGNFYIPRPLIYTLNRLIFSFFSFIITFMNLCSMQCSTSAHRKERWETEHRILRFRDVSC